MSRVHSPRFEDLEARELLSKAHVAPVPKAPAVVTTPLVLTGTLAVNNNPKATQTISNPDGSTTTAVAIMGQLGAMGAVTGSWDDTADQYGDDSGIGVLRLHNAEGSITLEFNDATISRAMPAGHGAVFHEYAQVLAQGTGAYAHKTERGTIELISNNAQTVVKTLAIHTKGT